MITIGIDEVGRGCWAGPLVAGAVALDKPIDGLRDSKKLTKSKRNYLDVQIRQQANGFGLGWVWPQEIDQHGLTWAVKTAMERAYGQLAMAYDELIIDGNINYLPDEKNVKAIVKADDIVPAVSAASIIAKVARDTYMANLDEKYAQYGFAQHVGYGTAAHITALKLLGVSDIHRRSYKPIRALLSVGEL